MTVSTYVISSSLATSWATHHYSEPSERFSFGAIVGATAGLAVGSVTAVICSAFLLSSLISLCMSAKHQENNISNNYVEQPLL